MGCYICKQLRSDYYEEEAGDCWVCMSINLAIAAGILSVLTWFGVPTAGVAGLALLFGFRVGHVGYLFPNTPQYLPYIDFILKPLGTVPSEAEALKQFSEDVVRICNDEYDDEAAQKECVGDLTDVIALRYRKELTEEEFIAAMGLALDKDPSELREEMDDEKVVAAD